MKTILCVTALLLLLLAASTAPRVESIAKRQDQVVPSDRYSSIDENELRAYLEQLRGLNDSTVNSLVDQIEYELDRGNYTGAQLYLEQLQKYLSEKYGDVSGLDPELARSIAVVNSVKNVTSDGAVLDNAELLEYFSEIENNPELLGIAEKLREGQYLTGDEIEKLNEVLEEIGKIGVGGEPVGIPELKPIETGSEGVGGENTELPGNPGGGGGGPAYTVPDIGNFLPLAILAAALVTLYLYRDEVARMLEPVRMKMAEAAAAVAVARRRARDPVARLYQKYLVLAGILGYRRRASETPREFLRRVRHDWLRHAGVHVTRLYEKRFYGLLEVPPQEIAEARRLLSVRRTVGRRGRR